MAGIIGAVAGSAQSSTIKCAHGLQMFVSRGTGEATELGETKALVDNIAKQIDGSKIHPILYPATFDDPVYMLSVANGTKLVRKTITKYAKACPESKMAWFGYSQVETSYHSLRSWMLICHKGAQITSNNFCGMPYVWGAEQTENSTITPAQVQEIFALSQPLAKELTKNGQLAKHLFIVDEANSC
ncbi:uncharacterized protein N7529_011954 [Penicillium soppii]|uniref:uncharacterized protein n=1 Tax=Penicillium soppii TaxID=69789 RepID=UPI0025499F30|nr:uncharacterized protein N7529_011954 [Penicillium soppii]KAJ5852569.1 hypothetical protein N7529_011954 [Penicillium soppii]